MRMAIVVRSPFRQDDIQSGLRGISFKDGLLRAAISSGPSDLVRQRVDKGLGI